jgi:dye decolorizing peroxidase
MTLPDPSELPRREYLRALVAAGGTASLAACVDFLNDADEERSVPRGDPGNRPRRQHAWDAILDEDEHGVVSAPEHHVLLGLDLATDPDESDREQVESALVSLEDAYAYDPAGLLFTVGYAPSYFEAVGAESPLPEPEALTSLEDPEFDGSDATFHLASDNPDVVLEAEEALLGDRETANETEISASLEGVFERTSRRTGFVGEGLPAQFADEVGGVPDEMPEDAPFFMGFRSGFANSQAPEDRVTIQDGPYEGGTTTHVETLDIQLRTWFEQDDHWLRVAQLFSPEHAEQELVGEIGEKLGASTGIEDVVDETGRHARERGVVGHAQKTARARDDDGTPPLLRRDFNTTDREVPGIHFLSHQRTIGDFARARRAMAGEDLDGGVGTRHNNGLLQYVFTVSRGNYLVPPRERRSLPEV